MVAAGCLLPPKSISLSLLIRCRFHVTTTYAILRMKGVDVGKLDFLTAGKPLGVEKKDE